MQAFTVDGAAKAARPAAPAMMWRGLPAAIMVRVEVRLAGHSDAEAIIAFDAVAQSERSRVNFIYRTITARTCHVASINRRVLGYGVLDYSFFENGFVSMLYVHPHFRRQRIGLSLMQHMERACKTHKLFASTGAANHAMRALLESMGYEGSGYIENLDPQDRELVYFKQFR